LKKHAGLVRSYFAPSPQVVTIASRIEKNIRYCDGEKKGQRIVGVHIRRRDYRDYKGGVYFYEWGVYAAYMRRLSELLAGQCRFVLCCEEPLELSAFDGLEIASGPGDLLGDLLALSACDYIIGPPSTFSGWASFSREVPRHFIQTAELGRANQLQLADFSIEWDGWT
jgi:hypothetical protein